MSEIPDRNTLLDDIELRQDDLLRQLDELNGRIEVVLREQTAAMGIPYKGAKQEDSQAEKVAAAVSPAATPTDSTSVAAVQMPGLVDRAEQAQSKRQAHHHAK